MSYKSCPTEKVARQKNTEAIVKRNCTECFKPGRKYRDCEGKKRKLEMEGFSRNCLEN